MPWIINAYILAFGSLLLLGGRIGDLFGRRRVLRVGLVIFAGASLLGGLGVNVEMLVLARGFQLGGERVALVKRRLGARERLLPLEVRLRRLVFGAFEARLRQRS